MAGGKASDQQPCDTPDDAPPAPRLTRSMAKAAAVPLRLMSPGKQPEGKSKPPQKGKTVAEQSKKARTTTIPTTPAEQTSEPPSDAFSAALVAIPADDWCRTWAADRTMLLRMTSKGVKEVVDKLRPPAAVKVSKAFRADARHGTAAEQLQHILRQLKKMTCHCRITRLDLSSCSISGQDAERLAGVLAQCPGLFELDLSRNEIGDDGAGSLAGVVPQCPALSQLRLREIRSALREQGL